MLNFAIQNSSLEFKSRLVYTLIFSKRLYILKKNNVKPQL